MNIKNQHINTKNIDTLVDVASIYFIGIGGIGMSALACYFHSLGKRVAGYDKRASEVTAQLELLGVSISYQDDEKLIFSEFLDADTTMVVYTPAIPADNNILNYFKIKEFNVLKRAEVLGVVTQNSFCMAVAGTHGKTTTSTILGHIMQSEKATVFLGGISENYNSNYIEGNTSLTVVEADEYDRSFLTLAPNIACVTSVDSDHLDIYNSKEELISSFEQFACKVSDRLVVAKGVPLEGMTYAIEEDADYMATNIRVENTCYVFDVKTPTFRLNNIKFALPGEHNIMNALASIAMADLYGVSSEVIKERIETFRGVKRRFSYKIKTASCVLIDDYAHHPSEIDVVAQAVRQIYPSKTVLAVFQPHLYSRTRDFFVEFASSLSKFDELLLLDIYPARELPIEGVSSEGLLNEVSLQKKKLTDKISLVNDINASEAEVIVMMGAGDIGELVEEVKKSLIQRIG